MKKQMKTNLFSVALGIGLIGVMLSSSTGKSVATAANQTQTLQEVPIFIPAAANVAAVQTSVPFTVYLSFLTAFTNGQSIDFNAMSEEGQSSIWDKMTNWKEEQ